MIYVYLNAATPSIDLDTYLATFNTEQLANDTVCVLCDTSASAITVNLPRCQNYPIGNLKLLVVDRTGNAETHNITVNAATATSSQPADAINGETSMIIAKNDNAINFQMTYPSLFGDVTNGGLWCGTYNV